MRLQPDTWTLQFHWNFCAIHIIDAILPNEKLTCHMLERQSCPAVERILGSNWNMYNAFVCKYSYYFLSNWIVCVWLSFAVFMKTHNFFHTISPLFHFFFSLHETPCAVSCTLEFSHGMQANRTRCGKASRMNFIYTIPKTI